jgi:rod shape determining protein RodA
VKNWLIPLLAFSLGLMGLVTLASVSPDLMRRQLVFLFISFLVFYVVSQVPLKFWWNWSDWLWKGLIVILIGLLLFGRVTRGAAAWIDLGWGLRFQPSQFAIIVTSLLVLVRFTKQQMLREKQLVELIVLLGLPTVLILLQPDFGTVFLYTVAVAPLLLWQKIPRKYWQWFLAGTAIILVIGWTLVLKPYQRLRITSFLSGNQVDQQSAGYNARQALIAVGSGQLFGRGLGHGSQSQLRFLPERQTDFIFASLAEEWGLVGSLTVIALYAALIYFLIQQAAKITNVRQSLLLIVVAVYFLAQVFVNIGMNVGLLPITGVTLPLVSYGGSSLLATMTLLGLSEQVILQSRPSRYQRIS